MNILNNPNKENNTIINNTLKSKPKNYFRIFIIVISILLIIAVIRIPYIGSTIDDYTLKPLFGYFRFPVYLGCLYACFLYLFKHKMHKFIQIRLIYIILCLISITLFVALVDDHSWLKSEQNISIVAKEFWQHFQVYMVHIGSLGYASSPISGLLGTLYYWLMHHLLDLGWYSFLAFIIPLIIFLISISGLITFRPLHLYICFINRLVYIHRQKKLKTQISNMPLNEKKKYPFIANTQEIDMDLAITQELGSIPTMTHYVPSINKVKTKEFSIFNHKKPIDQKMKAEVNDKATNKQINESNKVNYAKQTAYDKGINAFVEDNTSNEEEMLKSKKANISKLIKHDKYNIPEIDYATGKPIFKDEKALHTAEMILGNKYAKEFAMNFNPNKQIIPNSSKNRDADFAAIEQGKNPYTRIHNSDANLIKNNTININDIDDDIVTINSSNPNFISKTTMTSDKVENLKRIIGKNIENKVTAKEIDKKLIIEDVPDLSKNDSFSNDDVMVEGIPETFLDDEISKEDIKGIVNRDNLQQSAIKNNSKLSDDNLYPDTNQGEEVLGDNHGNNLFLEPNHDNYEITLKEKIKYEDYDCPNPNIIEEIQPNFNQEDLEDYINGLIEKVIHSITTLDIPLKYSYYQLGPSIIRLIFAPLENFRIGNLNKQEDDLKFNLGTTKLTINSPINNTNNVGIDLPLNDKFRQIVNFKTLLDSERTQEENPNQILAPLGKNLYGKNEFLDITKSPHVLIAGATGSGKSIAINIIISSIVMNYKPSDVRLLLIDPKQVELNLYENIPHLLSPIVKNIDGAVMAFKQLISEMEERYNFLSQNNCKNIQSYNSKTAYDKQMPYIIVIVDEFADLILSGAKDLETQITRLTQLARAAGIHLILATQRPSVNVITGLIKSNIPTRISFAVKSQIDSRTILDEKGAEDLIGNGDMLFSNYGSSELLRIQGAYISDNDINNIVNAIAKYAPIFDSRYQSPDKGTDIWGDKDELVDEAKEYLNSLDLDKIKVNPSLIMRRFAVGWSRARKILDQIENDFSQNN